MGSELNLQNPQHLLNCQNPVRFKSLVFLLLSVVGQTLSCFCVANSIERGMDNREIFRNGREEIMGGEEHRRGVHDRDVMRGVREESA